MPLCFDRGYTLHRTAITKKVDPCTPIETPGIDRASRIRAGTGWPGSLSYEVAALKVLRNVKAPSLRECHVMTYRSR